MNPWLDERERERERESNKALPKHDIKTFKIIIMRLK
jgi:hypothetical protein